MKHIWLYINKSDIETERLQCEQEGKDLNLLSDDFEKVLALDLENPKNQAAAERLLDKTHELPMLLTYPYEEPSDLEGIREHRPLAVDLPKVKIGDADLEDKVYGAWVGRCVGCLLGKPVEGFRRPRMWGYLKDLNRYPLNDFFRYDIASEELRAKYELDNWKKWRTTIDQVNYMPEDDDTNYTTTGLAILKRYGADFTPTDVANFWLSDIPILHTCTAERVAYRNLCLLMAPPRSATFRNVYREWIGAQIRADFWGYANPGNPERAAEFAWRDASISHIKNGIYGEMWVAAMIAAAFVTTDIKTIIKAGLAQIPENSRLSSAVEDILEWYELDVDYDTTVYRIHEIWDENRAHDWCHTISNAMVVTAGLLYGEGDYAKTICRAVQPCFDTDCNGATVGSILGILHGRKNLPSQWVDPINDTLKTGVTGYHTVKLADMTRESLEIIEKIAQSE